MEGFSFVTPITGLSRPNTGKEDDDKHFILIARKGNLLKCYNHRAFIGNLFSLLSFFPYCFQGVHVKIGCWKYLLWLDMVARSGLFLHHFPLGGGWGGYLDANTCLCQDLQRDL
jgi:hypothetical protein